MEKKRIAVIFGGHSPEYDVSLNSSYSIIRAIDHEKYDVILLGIDREGAWYKYTGDVENIPVDKWQDDSRYLKRAFISPERSGGLLEFNDDGRAEFTPLDAVFPVLHGRYGEDGTVQGLCELAGIPVVGSGAASSALCMDKDRAHKLVSLTGIRTPKAICFEHVPSDEDLRLAARDIPLPLFVKPVKAGSSFGISKIDDYGDLAAAVAEALTIDDAVLIEESIDGFETGCSVVGNNELMTGRIDEIELAGGFFTYEEKYTLKTSKIHMPARIDEQTEKKLQAAAITIYRTLGCKGYARVDMFLTRDNEIVFNEANTIPGFTAHSRFPNMMKGVGIDYPELIDMLISYSIERT